MVKIVRNKFVILLSGLMFVFIAEGQDNQVSVEVSDPGGNPIRAQIYSSKGYINDTDNNGKRTFEINCESHKMIFASHDLYRNSEKIRCGPIIKLQLTAKFRSPLGRGQTLADVQARGELNCIVTTGLAGFAAPDENGRWEGLDAGFCRAVAAAVLGDGEKVKFVPSTGKTRFTLLNSGEGDILFRNTTETMSRDTDLKLNFLPVTYYDGQGFLVRKDLGVSSASELDGASVCIQTGTTTELNLADYFRANGMSYEPVNIETNEEGISNYSANRCDVYTTDASGLASTRAALDDPSAHVLLPEIISKEPLGGATRHGDDQWSDIGKWVVNAIINAEELGVTSENIDSLCAAAGDNPSVNRLCGTEGDMGAMIGLDAQWAVRAIKAGGNYAERYEAHVGPNTPLALERGLNKSWRDGGILYAAPIR